MKRKVFLLAISLFAVTLTVFGQAEKKQPASPPATATGKAAGANITINYSSPSVKGRTIWGGLLPYDSVWRAGANMATVFETDKAIKLEGKELPAGKYSLFIRPTMDKWEVIFNSETGQWGIKRGGVANRDSANDVLSVMVKPKESAMNERLVYEVNKNGFVLKWDKIELPVSIR